MDVLKEIRREIYPLAPLHEHGEDGTTGHADEDDKNGANPQMEVGVGTSAAIAVLVLSILQHFLWRCREGEEGIRGG